MESELDPDTVSDTRTPQTYGNAAKKQPFYIFLLFLFNQIEFVDYFVAITPNSFPNPG